MAGIKETAENLQQHKKKAVPYFSILNRLKPQMYHTFSFRTIYVHMHTLVVAFFSIFNNIRLQSYLILAFQIV